MCLKGDQSVTDAKDCDACTAARRTRTQAEQKPSKAKSQHMDFPARSSSFKPTAASTGDGKD